MENHVYSTRQIRETEQRVFAGDMASDALMQRAGAAVMAVIRRRFPAVQRLTVLCGAGNNGGDGYVVARLAHEAGLAVTIRFAAPPKTPDARIMAAQSGVSAEPWNGSLPEADLYLDALLGIGLNAPVTGVAAEMIRALNLAAAPVVAVDVPSGIDADTGAVRGVAVNAALTVTFIGHKPGLLTGDGASHTGILELAPLRLPPDVYPPSGVAEYLSRDTLHFAPRPRNSHKGAFGHVLVVGGDEGMGGAAMMTAEAALRAGAGRVSVATHPSHVAALLARCPEIMVRGVTHVAELAPMMEAATLIVVGPGLGRMAWGQRLWNGVKDCPKPLVVDADALYWLSQEPDRRDNRVLTPHPGEAGFLLACETLHIQENRLQAAQTLVARYGGTVVLKGAGSLVASAERLAVCPYGNPGMSTAGMGDMLAGVVAGLAGQFGLSPQTVAQAVLVHALAGDQAAAAQPRGLLATDLLPFIREWVNV